MMLFITRTEKESWGNLKGGGPRGAGPRRTMMERWLLPTRLDSGVPARVTQHLAGQCSDQARSALSKLGEYIVCCVMSSMWKAPVVQEQVVY